jgi:hypothetical protein
MHCSNMEHEPETWIELTATVRNVIAFLIGKTDRAKSPKEAAEAQPTEIENDASASRPDQ